jgi:micrococcal nuclease
VLALLVCAAALAACGSDRPATRPTGHGAASTAPRPTAGVPASLPAGLDAVVTSVTDGDTVVVRTAAGTTERVRLIGIDTPETRDPRRPVECFGREASARTAALVPPGTAVRLELDVEERDRYGRLLAYVWKAADASLVNAALVEGGWAVPYRYPPNVRYADLFSRLGAEARAADRGLWSACGGADTPASTD